MAYITIKNSALEVQADTLAATLHSVRKNGVEYLWQGDEKYWKFQDKNLFPYVGRMTDEKYIYNGEEYHMTIHGFCGDKEFEVTDQSETSVTLTLKDSPETREIYPFNFEFSVTYSLEGSVLYKKCSVKNTGDGEMYFGLGSHPGFNVPLDGTGEFSDWYFEFSEPCDPERVCFDPANYRLSGETVPYELREGKVLPLEHSCFDLDAIVLGKTSGCVTLKSDKSPACVKVSYPQMPFLGLWHKPCSDAPYVCIEPWVSLPSHSAYVEDIAEQEYIIHLAAGQEYVNTLSFEIV